MRNRRLPTLAIALLAILPPAPPSAAAQTLGQTTASSQGLPASQVPASTQPTAAPSALETTPLLTQERRASRAAPATRPAAGAPRMTSSIGVDLGRMFLALLIVLGLIGGLYWLLRRFYGGAVSSSTTRAVKVLSRTPLSPRQQVMLLQVGRRVIVVGDSGGAMNTLAQIDDADEVAQLLGQLQGEQMSRAASFGSVFRRNQTSFDDAEATDRPALADGQSPGDAIEGDAPNDELAQQRSEVAGLLEKVRSLRGQIGR